MGITASSAWTLEIPPAALQNPKNTSDAVQTLGAINVSFLPLDAGVGWIRQGAPRRRADKKRVLYRAQSPRSGEMGNPFNNIA